MFAVIVDSKVTKLKFGFPASGDIYVEIQWMAMDHRVWIMHWSVVLLLSRKLVSFE